MISGTDISVLNKLKKLITKTTSVETTVGIINTNVNTANTTLSTVNTNASTAATKATSAATDAASIKSTVSTINTNVNTANTTLSTVNTNASTAATKATAAATDAASAKSNTATNNTASATGTLSQKLSHIINQNNAGGSQVKYNNFLTGVIQKNATESLSVTGQGRIQFYVDKTYDKNGTIKTITIDGTSFSSEITINNGCTITLYFSQSISVSVATNSSAPMVSIHYVVQTV